MLYLCRQPKGGDGRERAHLLIADIALLFLSRRDLSYRRTPAQCFYHQYTQLSDSHQWWGEEHRARVRHPRSIQCGRELCLRSAPHQFLGCGPSAILIANRAWEAERCFAEQC